MDSRIRRPQLSVNLRLRKEIDTPYGVEIDLLKGIIC